MGQVRKLPWPIALGVFLSLFALYVLTYTGQLRVVDEVYLFAATESLAEGRLDINQVASMQWGFDPVGQVGAFGPSGDLYCKKGVAVSLLGLPLYQVGSLLQRVGAVHVTILTNAIVVALSGGLLCSCLASIGFPRQISLLCSLLFGVGTLAWPYTRWFLAEPVAGLGLLLAFWGFSLFHRTRSFGSGVLGGLGLGVALAAVPASILVAPVLALAVAADVLFFGKAGSRWMKLRGALGGVVIGLAVPVMLVSLYNGLRFSLPWLTGWKLSLDEFGSSLWEGLIGLFVSPARGLLFYCPVLILAVPGFVAGWRKRWFDLFLVAGMTAVLAVFYAKWTRWHGGWSWGARYLVPILPLLMIALAEGWSFVRRKLSLVGRVLLFSLAGVSILSQFFSVAGNYLDVEFVLRQRVGSYAEGWFYLGREALFDVTLSPLIIQAQRVLQGYLDWSWMSQGQPDGLALGAGLLGVAVGAGTLWAAWKAHRRFCLVTGLASVLLAATTSVVVLRASERPFYDLEADGRMEALSHIVSHKRAGDGVVSVVPYLHELMMDRYPDLPPVYGLPRAQEERPEVVRLLENAVECHERLWFLSVWTVPGDLSNRTELWLATHAFPLETREFGGYRVTLFSTPVAPQIDVFADVTFSDAIRLERLSVSRTGDAATTVQVALAWQALSAVEQDYQVFVHVYDREGHLVGQADHTPVGGFYPAFTWSLSDLIEDRIALQLPAGTGDYRLAVGLYDWRTGERLPAFAGSGATAVSGDAVWLSLETQND